MPQKAEEEFALQRYRHVSGLLPGSVIRCERPDFIVESSGRRVGVEVTRYYQARGRRGSSLRAVEAAHETVMADAKQIFERVQPGIALWVQPQFARREPLRRRDRRSVGEAVAGLVGDLVPPVPPPGSLATKEADWYKLRAAGLEGILTHLTVARIHAMKRSNWLPSSAAFAASDPEEIHQIIAEKEHKQTDYQPVHALELLIYSMPPASGSFDVAALHAGMFKSTFDRVTFIDLVSDHYVAVVVALEDLAF